MFLSDVAARQAKPYKLPDDTGLFLLINKTGRYWRYGYRFEGKRKTLSYGVYPNIALTVTRDRHSEAKKQLAQGIDPMAERKTDKESAELTFQSIAQRWHTH